MSRPLANPSSTAPAPPAEPDDAVLDLARALARMLARQHDAAERESSGREG